MSKETKETKENHIGAVIAFYIVFVTLVGGFAFQSYHLQRYKSELDQARAELELSGRREQEVRQSVERMADVLYESATTVQQLRKQFEEVKDEYYRLVWIVYSDDGHIDNGKEVNGNDYDALVDTGRNAEGNKGKRKPEEARRGDR